MGVFSYAQAPSGAEKATQNYEEYPKYNQKGRNYAGDSNHYEEYPNCQKGRNYAEYPGYHEEYPNYNQKRRNYAKKGVVTEWSFQKQTWNCEENKNYDQKHTSNEKASGSSSSSWRSAKKRGQGVSRSSQARQSPCNILNYVPKPEKSDHQRKLWMVSISLWINSMKRVGRAEGRAAG